MKKFAFVVMIISIIGLLFFSVTQPSGISVYLDGPSMLVVFIFAVIPLIWSGSLLDIKIGILLIMSNETTFTLLQLKNALAAFEMVNKSLILASLFATLLGGITILTYLGDFSQLGPALAVMVLTIFYSVTIMIFVAPIQLRLKKEINRKTN